MSFIRMLFPFFEFARAVGALSPACRPRTRLSATGDSDLFSPVSKFHKRLIANELGSLTHRKVVCINKSGTTALLDFEEFSSQQSLISTDTSKHLWSK
jgi:hypothetical protein